MGDISEINARIDTAKSELDHVITRVNVDRQSLDESIMKFYIKVYEGSNPLLNAAQIASCIHLLDRHYETTIQMLSQAKEALENTKIY